MVLSRQLRVIGAPLALGLLLMLGGCSDSAGPEPTGKVINIGYIGDFEGAFRVEGANSLAGITTAATTFPYLENGDKLSIVSLPEGETAGDTLEALRTLEQEHDIAALLLGSASDRLLEIKNALVESEIPTLAIIATSNAVTKGSKNINQLSFTDHKQATVGALFARDELLLQRAAVFYEADSPYSSTLADVFREMFARTGGEITGFYTLDELGDDVLATLAVAGTEFLYLPMSAHGVITTVVKVNGMSWSPRMMGTDGLLTNVIKRNPGSADIVEGMYTTDVLSYESEFVKLNELGQLAGKQYREMFRGQDGDTYAALGVEAYAILQYAMNRCARPEDRHCINRRLRATDSFKGIVSRLSINPDGTSTRPVFVNAIENAQLHSVVQVY